jgi:tetratricopeptide (TPR) repeat protein
MATKPNIWRVSLIGAALVAGTWIAYWPVLGNGFVKFDDPDYVTSNLHVLRGLNLEDIRWAFTRSHSCNWHPLTWLSHMLDVQLFGLNPGWHHFTNLLLHTANLLLLFLLLRRLTGAVWRSAFVAALFALHPLHVESVAWVSERKDVLSTLFFVLTLWTYAEYVRRRKKGEGRREKGGSSAQLDESRLLSQSFTRRFYLLSLCCFALGLMSKPMLVTMPAVLVLFDIWPLRRTEFSKEPWKFKPLVPLLLEKVPFLVLAVLSSAVTFQVQNKGHAVTFGFPLGLRLANAVSSYWKYLGKMVWPTDLCVFYPHPDLGHYNPHPDLLHPASRQWPLWVIWIAAVALIAISIMVLFQMRKRPWAAAGWFWYLCTVAPVSGIIQMGSQAMADRYTYIPLIGIFIVVVWGANEIVARVRYARWGIAGIGIVALAACAAVTHTQTFYWRDNLTLFQHALKATHNHNMLAHCNVGMEFSDAGKYDLALAELSAALEDHPVYGDAFYYLGKTYERMGKIDEAMDNYRSALRIWPFHLYARFRLAELLHTHGKQFEALEQFSQATRFDPDNPEIFYRLGLALLDDGEWAEASAQFEKTLRLDSSYTEALAPLAKALLKQDRLTEAAARSVQLLRLEPANVDAHITYGGALWRLDRRGEALAHYKKASELMPSNPVPHYDLGTVWLAQRDLGAAATEFSEALRLKPDYTEAVADLGRALAGQGKLEEALPYLREAVRLCSTNANYFLALGNAQVLAGQTNEAVATFTNVARLQPDLPEKLALAGKSLASQGQPDAAVANFKTALWVRPDWPAGLNNLAWMLATHPQASARNGQEALRLAHRACDLTGGKEPRMWNTVAAAYAELGQFDDAVAAAEKARDMAVAAADTEAAASAETKLALYRQHQAYHQ